MFNVGDLIIGNDRNSYAMTRKGSICYVLKNECEYGILVCVVASDVEVYEAIKDSLDLNSEVLKSYETFWVDENAFDLFKNRSSEFILKGLFFRKDLKKLVTLKNAYVANPDRYIRIGEVYE